MTDTGLVSQQSTSLDALADAAATLAGCRDLAADMPGALRAFRAALGAEQLNVLQMVESAGFTRLETRWSTEAKAGPESDTWPNRMLLAAQAGTPYEKVCSGKSQRHSPAHVLSVPLRNGDGPWGTLVAILPDASTEDHRSGMRLAAACISSAITIDASREHQLTLQERYTELIENANDTIYTTDLTGTFLTANRAAAELTEYPLEELPGKNLTDLLTEDSVARAREMMGRKLRGDTSATRYVLELRTASGQVRPIEVSTRLLYRDGKPIGSQGIARDMTAQRAIDRAHQREEALLRQSEASFRALFHDSPQPMLVCDAETLEVLEANHRACEQYGYSAGQLRKRSLKDLEAEPTEAQPDAMLPKNSRHRTSDGRVIDVEIHVQDIEFNTRKALLLVLEDVTEALRRERELRTAIELNERLMTSVSDAIFSTDAGGILEYVNNSLLEQTGYEESDLVGKSFRVLLPPEDQHRVGLAIEQMVEGRGRVRVQVAIVCKDGAHRLFDWGVAPIVEGGAEIGYVACGHDISKERARDNAIARLAAIVESSSDAIITATTQGTIMSWNPAAERLWGYPATEAIGKRLNTLVSAPVLEGVRTEKLVANLVSGKPSAFELPLLRADGTEVLASVSAFPVRDSNGDVIAVAGIVRDVTDSRKQAAERARLAGIVEYSNDIIMATDAEGRLTHWNAAAERILGWRAHEVLGRTLAFLLPEDQMSRGAQIVQAIATGGTLEQFEVAATHKDGRRVLTSLSAFPVYAEDGTVISFAGIARDITAQRAAEEDLREREEMLDLTYKAANAGIVIVDEEGYFVRVNDRYAEMVGRTVEELIGSPFSTVLDEDAQKAARRNLALRRDGVQTPVRDWVVRRPDGSTITLESTATLFHREDGSRYTVAVTIDVTEARAAADAMREREEMLELTHRALNVGVLVADEAGTIVSANEALCDVLGLEHDQLVGRTYPEVLTPFDVETSWRRHERRMAQPPGSIGTQREWKTRRADGQVRIATSISGRFDRSDGRKFLVTVINDVTELRESVRRSRELAAILEGSNDVIVSFAADGRVSTWNRGAERILGWKASDVIGQPMESLDERLQQVLLALSQEGHDEDVWELTVPTAAGELVSLSAAAVSVDATESLGALRAVIARDITDQLAIADELRRRVRELQGLYRLRVALSESNSVEALVEAGLAALKACLGADFGSMRIVDGNGTARWIGHFHDLSDNFLEQLSRLELPEVATIGTETYVISDLDSLPDSASPVLPLMRAEGIQSVLAQPVVVSGRPVAQLTVWTKTPHPWQRQDTQLAETVAATIGSAISQLQTEEALKASIERFEIVSRATNDAIWDWDINENRVWWSDGFCERFGYERDEIEPGIEFWLDRLHEGDRERVEAGFRRASEVPGARWSDEYRFRRADGTYAYILDRGEVVGVDGRATRMIGSMVDISAVREAQKELAERERFLNAIIENSPLGIQVFDAEGVSRRMNEAQRRQIGVADTSQGIGKYNILQDSGEDTQALARRAYAGETIETVDRFIDFRGSGDRWGVTIDSAWFDQWFFPVKGSNGAVEAMVAMTADATRRKQAELARQVAENRLMAITNSLPIVLLAASPDGTITLSAGLGLKAIGGEPEQLTGKNGLDPAVLGEGFTAGMRRALSGASFTDLVTVGSAVFEWHFQAIAAPDGDLAGVTAVGLDISERRRTEEALLQAQKLESLGVLAGGIAHDFNNLLVAILGNAGLALTELGPDSPARDTVEEIEIAAHRASDLARQMLAYSGKGKFVVQRVDMNELVKEMAHLLRVSIPKNTSIDYDFYAGLPAVEADTTQIRQVVMNLITNAADAIGDRGGTLAISTGLVHADKQYLAGMYLAPDIPEGEYVYIQVADTGSGMDQETLSRIFDPFFTTKFTGRGLGLAAVLGIVRGHRGALRVHSEPGKGTTFRILLPKAEGHAEGQATGHDSASGWTASGTILLIDDDDTVRSVTTRALQHFGFEVLCAMDGEEGVELYREHADEVVGVLLDLTMPRLDGAGVFAELRQIRPEVKVVLMTGFPRQEAMEHFEGHGLAGFIQKPYDMEALRQALRDALE